MSYPKFEEWSEEDRNKLISNFKILEKEINQLGYDVILHGGTLLGCVREKNLIKKDNDIDFIILHKSTDKEEIIKEINAIDTYFYQQKRICKDLHYLGNNHYYVDGQHFDGWHGWFDENDKFYVCWDIYGELIKSDILPLKSELLLDTYFNIPAKSKKLLDLLYGTNWNQPKDKKHNITGRDIYKFLNGYNYLYPQQKLSQKEILLDLRHLLSSHGIKYWLMTGTLLGAIREQNFIEHDPNDIDLGLDIADYWKVKELLDKSDYKYKCQWHKEIAIYKGENVHPHIDLFFHTFDEKYAYCYSYKPNRIHKHWNEEWRMKIPKSLIFPLKSDFMFLDRSFIIPNKPEKYLELLYGEDWKIPNPSWTYHNFGNIDNNYHAITAIVTTFNRPDCLYKLIDSFCALYPDIELLIGNQNKEPIQVNYDNVKVIQLPYDCGLSYARNELVKCVKTEFTLLLEDDFVMLKNTNLYDMMEVFSADKNIGLVGGRLFKNNRIFSYEKYLFILNKILVSIDWQKCVDSSIIQQHKIGTITFGICDIIYNFFLAKTEVLKQYPWDVKHKIHSEHLDYFLNLKLNSDVKIAFMPNIIIGHDHPINDDIDYLKFRERMYYNYIYDKYGIEKGYTLGESALINYKENRKETV